jgi:glyoxylase-like metal-dependent hydrolase (beta-lactamase superfamily II)
MNLTCTDLSVHTDTSAFTTWIPVPGLGVLPVISYLIQASEPVLIDTGLAAARPAFLDALQRRIDPSALRWIWLTHTDPDHVGNLAAVLELAPRARVVTNFLGMGKLGLLGLPQERVYLLNPGQALAFGDRQLRALRPPVYDAPETMALFDESSRTLFSADCFGAVLPEAAESADSINANVLRDGMVTWTGVDAPWLAATDELMFEAACSGLSALRPACVLGSHLPPARDAGLLLGHLQTARTAEPFVGPDQQALEAALQIKAA